MAPADYFFWGDEEAETAPQLTPRQETHLVQQQLIEQNAPEGIRNLLWGVPMKDGRTAVMVKEAVTSPVGEESLLALIAVGPAVAHELTGVAPGVERRWPHEVIVHFDRGVMGYAIASVPEGFREGDQLRTLASLLTRRDPRASVDLVIGLLRLIAQWLEVLHRSGVVFGDLDPDNIAYASDGPVICPIDFSMARVLGTGNWRRDFGQGQKSLATDRAAYAELVDVLLAAACAGPAPDGGWWDEFARNHPTTAARVGSLRDRAATNAEAPPNMQEWCGAFAAP